MSLTRRELLLSTIPVLCAQDSATFTSDVKVVNVLATVRTKKGEIVRDLGKDDFTVLENNRPQAIRYFSRESDLPLTLGLMVDTSMSQARVMDAERAASYRFFDHVLRPRKDQVFIMQFDMAVQLKQELTSSLKKLDDALAFVDTPTRRELREQRGGGTLLYDAVIKASRDFMAAQQGRKALIILSDGVDYGSEGTVQDAVDAATRADTLVYSILFSDSGFYAVPFIGHHEDGAGVLQRMSRETGGGFFTVSKKVGLDEIFDRIQDELRSEYSLGYVSDVPVRTSEFRKIRLTTANNALVVQARDKYWARR